jgi:cytochrome c
MKSKLIVSLLMAAAGALLTAAPAMAAPDADAAQALAKKSGCLKCHAVDKSKKGPSFQKTAAKWKGKADAESKLIDNITKAPKVKFEDGTEEEHKVVDSKDSKEIKNLVAWILAQ